MHKYPTLVVTIYPQYLFCRDTVTIMDVSDQILTILSKTNKSLTISEISLQADLERHTVAKYLGILEVIGRVRKIEHGNAKKYFLISSVPVSGLIDISSDLIIIVNKNLQIQYVNSAASHMLGLENQSILGERIDLLKVDLFSSPDIIEGLKHYSSNKVFRTEITHTDERTYLVTILEISLDPGKTLIAITAEDISERKKRELEICESEEKYRALFTTSTDPVILIDQESGSIIEGNTAACKVYGYECHDFCQLSITDISPKPEEASQMSLHPIPFIPKQYHRQRNGNRFPVEISTAVVEIKDRIVVIATIKDISERIRGEEALKQMHLNFNAFFNTIDEMVFVLDEKGIILEINETVIKKLGYTRSDLIGVPVNHLHPPERLEEATRIVKDIIGGKATFCPIPIMTRDGELIPAHTSVTHGVWDGNSAIFGVSKDISELCSSEEKFSKSFHWCSTPRAISTFKEGRFIDVNESFLKTLGYSREEVIGKTSAELGLFSPLDTREKIKRLTEDNNPVATQEVHVRTKDGSVRNGLFSATKVQIGDEFHLLTSMVDITDLRNAERELWESEKRYRTLLETLHEGIWAIDTDAITTFVNSKMEQMLGYAPGEMNGRHLFSFMDQTGISIAEKNINKRKDGISEKHEFAFLKTDGSLVHTILETVPILDVNGTYLGAIAGVTDISQQKRNEQILRETEEKFRILFNSSPDAIIMIEQQTGRICDANRTASLLYGYEYDELIRLKNTDLSAEPDKTWQEAHTLVQRVPLRHHIRKDGTIFPVEISATTLTLQDIPYLLITIREIDWYGKTGQRMSDNPAPQDKRRGHEEG